MITGAFNTSVSEESQKQTGFTGFIGRDTHGGQFLDVLVRRAQRRQTDLLRELSELWIGEQRNVTEQLVTRVPETKRQ